MSAEVLNIADPRTRSCSKCGAVHPLTIDYFNRLGGGFQSRCRTCDRAAGRETRRNRIFREGPLTAERIKKYQKSLKGRFSQYKTGAKLRALNWELSLDDFKSFWKASCEYCENPIETIGLDRIDSSIGYIKSNLVSCCSRCNRAKHTMSLSEFKVFIETLYRRFFEN